MNFLGALLEFSYFHPYLSNIIFFGVPGAVIVYFVFYFENKKREEDKN